MGLDPRAGGRGRLRRSDSGSCVPEARGGGRPVSAAIPVGLAWPHLEHVDTSGQDTVNRGFVGGAGGARALTCLLSIWEVAAT